MLSSFSTISFLNKTFDDIFSLSLNKSIDTILYNTNSYYDHNYDYIIIFLFYYYLHYLNNQTFEFEYDYAINYFISTIDPTVKFEILLNYSDLILYKINFELESFIFLVVHNKLKYLGLL
jgi:hypothetical protein